MNIPLILAIFWVIGTTLYCVDNSNKIKDLTAQEYLDHQCIIELNKEFSDVRDLAQAIKQQNEYLKYFTPPTDTTLSDPKQAVRTL